MGTQTDLNEKQKLFVQEYLLDFNGTRAAIAAGYAESGAAVESSRLLRNAKVQELLAGQIAQRNKRLEKTGDDIIAELEKIAFGSKSDYEEWESFNFNHKVKALELLARHRGVCIPKKLLEHSGNLGLSPEINELVKLSPEDRKARLELLKQKQMNGGDK